MCAGKKVDTMMSDQVRSQVASSAKPVGSCGSKKCETCMVQALPHTMAYLPYVEVIGYNVTDGLLRRTVGGLMNFIQIPYLIQYHIVIYSIIRIIS